MYVHESVCQWSVVRECMSMIESNKDGVKAMQRLHDKVRYEAIERPIFDRLKCQQLSGSTKENQYIYIKQNTIDYSIGQSMIADYKVLGPQL